MMQRQQNLIYPISDWELKQLKKGATSNPHWHDIVEKDDTFCAIIGLEINEDDYDHLSEKGIHCLRCQIDPESIKTIERGDIEVASYQVHGGVKIAILMMMDYRAKEIAHLPLNNMPLESDKVSALFKLYQDSLRFVQAEHQEDLTILWENFGMKMDEVSKRFFFAQYVHIVYCSGFKYQIVKDKWKAICKVYKDFDYAKVDWHRDSVKMEAMEEGMIRHEGKVKAILDTARWLKDISHTGFVMFLEAGLKDIDTFKELGYLGDKTKYHMGICLGFDVMKPDTHLEAIADHFEMLPLDLCQLIADKFEVPIRLVDAVFWRASEQDRIKEGVFVQDS